MAAICHRHGLKGLFSYCLARASRRVVGVEFCKITQSRNVHSYAPIDGYSMLVFHKDHPCSSGHPAYKSVQAFISTHALAIRSGHYAVVTLHCDEIVGHNFYAFSAVSVTPGIVFSPARWTFFRDWRYAIGLDHRTIAYIALDNFSSLASGISTDSKIIGYSAWRGGLKSWCYRSPSARRYCVDFDVLA